MTSNISTIATKLVHPIIVVINKKLMGKIKSDNDVLFLFMFKSCILFQILNVLAFSTKYRILHLVAHISLVPTLVILETV